MERRGNFDIIRSLIKHRLAYKIFGDVIITIKKYINHKFKPKQTLIIVCAVHNQNKHFCVRWEDANNPLISSLL